MPSSRQCSRGPGFICVRCARVHAVDCVLSHWVCVGGESLPRLQPVDAAIVIAPKDIYGKNS
jgi:protein gp37